MRALAFSMPERKVGSGLYGTLRRTAMSGLSGQDLPVLPEPCPVSPVYATGN